MNTQMSKLIEGLQRNYKFKSKRVPTYVLVSAQTVNQLVVGSIPTAGAN